MLSRLKPIFDKNLLAFTLLLAWLVLLVLDQANPYLVPIGRDNGFFLYAGARLLAGKQLYLDIWDHKGPAIFLVNALGQLLVQHSRWGVWLLEYLFIFSAFFIGYLTIKRHWGAAPALIGALTGFLVLQNTLGRGNLTEEYPLLFNFTAAYIFFRTSQKKALWPEVFVGALFGLAFLFRANNGGVPLSIGLAILLTGLLNQEWARTFQRLAGLALGAAVLFIVTALIFAQLGTLQAMFEAALLYNFLDTQGQLNLITGLVAGFKNLGVVFYVLLAGYTTAIVKLAIALRQKQTRTKDFELLAFLVIAWPVELTLSSLSGLKFVHYFICWVPVAFLLGSFAYQALSENLFSSKVLSFLPTWRANILFFLLTMVFSIPIVLNYAVTFQALAFNRQNGIDLNDRLSDFIRSTTAPNEPVLVWGGEAGINFTSGRHSPTRYNLFSRLLSDHPMNQAISERFTADVLENPPELVIDGWKHSPDSIPSLNPAIQAQQETRRVWSDFPAYGRLRDFIANHYVYETTIDGYEIYRLKK